MRIRQNPLHREGSRSCIAWCNGNRHPAEARLRDSRRWPSYSPVGCSRNGNFRAVHAEIILEASSGGAAKSVPAWHCLGHILNDVYQGAHTWRAWPRCSLESSPKRADSREMVRISSRKPQQGRPLQVSLGGSDAAIPLRRRYLHHYEQRNDCWSCRSWRGYDNRVQPGGSRHTDHPSHHPCSELRILQHSDQDIWLWCDRHSHTSSSTFPYNQYRVQHHGELRDREKTQRGINIGRTCMCSGSSTQCGSPSLRDPHWMRLNVCHEGAL